jgi:DNA (cytosine-5)-methyltransferase 3A
MAIKILIGGSPCTHWSIAQKNNRETLPEGLGWELFKNYLIAKEKFKPDFFLYENNKSAAQAIKDQIATEFGVGIEHNVRFTYINSALVSAQNRQRFYVTNFGDIEQPEDRGILLKDILERGCDLTGNDKSYVLTASYGGACAWNTIERSQRPMVAESVGIGYRGRNEDGEWKKRYESNGEQKANALTTAPTDSMVSEPINITEDGKSQTIKAQYQQTSPANILGYTSTYGASGVAEPLGYATPVEWNVNGEPTAAVSPADGKTYTVYRVEDGLITINEKTYPIKLEDRYYIIRKLTVRECARLQTMPDDYCKAVSDSQAYKALGNGWTAEVIIHLPNHALKDVPRDEEIIVLSMYDGIATGRYCLDKMGFTNVKYHAYEIDKYPIQVAMDNYPDIIQHGDAFAVREDDWKPPQTQSEWLDSLLEG